MTTRNPHDRRRPAEILQRADRARHAGVSRPQPPAQALPTRGFRLGRRSGPSPRRRVNWPRAVPYLTAGWSLLYAALSAAWAFGAPGFPFGEGDPKSEGSVLEWARPEITAPVIAVLCLAGVAVAGLLAGRPLPRRLHRGLLAFAVAAAVALAVVIPDFRLLAALGYAPIFVVGAPFGFPPVSFVDVFPWATLNQILCTAGGVLWAATAVVAARRATSACEHCGRPHDADRHADHWTSPERARRWGRVAVGIAVVVPVLYALDRFAWLAGIPLGISDDLMNSVRDTDVRWAALGLGLGAVGGAVLTLGLAQRWGEVFPRWIPFLRGRRVPPAVAVVPGTLVSVLVLSAGVMVNRLWLSGAFPDEDVSAVIPMIPWPLWGLGLGAATLAYHYRRRGTCRHCGRG